MEWGDGRGRHQGTLCSGVLASSRSPTLPHWHEGQRDCLAVDTRPGDGEVQERDSASADYTSSDWLLEHISSPRLPFVTAWIMLTSVPIADEAFPMTLTLSNSLKDVDKSDMPFERVSLLKSGLVSKEMSYFSCAALPAWSTLSHSFLQCVSRYVRSRHRS